MFLLWILTSAVNKWVLTFCMLLMWIEKVDWLNFRISIVLLKDNNKTQIKVGSRSVGQPLRDWLAIKRKCKCTCHSFSGRLCTQEFSMNCSYTLFMFFANNGLLWKTQTLCWARQSPFCHALNRFKRALFSWGNHPLLPSLSYLRGFTTLVIFKTLKMINLLN